MTAADKIHALADTGTPPPWESDDGSAMWAEHGTEEGPYNYVGSTEDPSDAAKIVAAVNALPEVADYDDAVMAYFQHQTECTSGPSCPTLAAKWVAVTTHRARLYKALGVTP